MTHIAETSPTRRTSAGIAARALAPLRAGWQEWRRERQLRAAVASLGRLDDHLLRDIGLNRGDIEAGVRHRSR